MRPIIRPVRMRVPSRLTGQWETLRARATLTIALAATVLLSACSFGASGAAGPGGETTCREWLALDENLSAEERLYEGKENEEQQAILKRMLAAHDRDTGETNRINAEWAIIQFCSPDDTGTRQNIDRPIEDAIDW
jgi:hypothetical protein